MPDLTLRRKIRPRGNWTCAILIMALCGGCADGEAKTDLSRLDLLLQKSDFLPVQLRRISTGHHWLTASLNGVSGNFILDTGAGGTVLDPGALARFGIDPAAVREEKTSAGAGGAVTVKLYAVEQFSIDENELELAEINVVDLSAVLPALSRTAGVTLHGIVGQDVLTAHGGILEVAADRLFLRRHATEKASNPSTAQAWAGTLTDYLALPLTKLASGHETIRVEINGVEGHFVIDSGARLSVVNLGRLAHFAITAPDRIATDSASGGIGGAISIRQYRVRSFRLEEQILPQLTLGSFDLSAVVSAIETETGSTIDGVIGQDILIRHRAIIDIAAQQLLLTELPET